MKGLAEMANAAAGGARRGWPTRQRAGVMRWVGQVAGAPRLEDFAVAVGCPAGAEGAARRRGAARHRRWVQTCEVSKPGVGVGVECWKGSWLEVEDEIMSLDSLNADRMVEKSEGRLSHFPLNRS